MKFTVPSSCTEPLALHQPLQDKDKDKAELDTAPRSPQGHRQRTLGKEEIQEHFFL